MSPTRLLPAALLAVSLPLAGCAAGQNDTTSHERGTPYTADATVGPIFVRNVVITPATSAASSTPSASASASASPTASSSATPSGSPSASASASPSPSSSSAPQAYLLLTAASSTPDQLTGATVSGGGTVTPSSGADLRVKPQQLLMIVNPEAGGADASKPSLEITGLASPPVLGTTMTVTLRFQNAGTVTIQAPVRELAPA